MPLEAQNSSVQPLSVALALWIDCLLANSLMKILDIKNPACPSSTIKLSSKT